MCSFYYSVKLHRGAITLHFQTPRLHSTPVRFCSCLYYIVGTSLIYGVLHTILKRYMKQVFYVLYVRESFKDHILGNCPTHFGNKIVGALKHA